MNQLYVYIYTLVSSFYKRGILDCSVQIVRFHIVKGTVILKLSPFLSLEEPVARLSIEVLSQIYLILKFG